MSFFKCNACDVAQREKNVHLIKSANVCFKIQNRLLMIKDKGAISILKLFSTLLLQRSNSSISPSTATSPRSLRRLSPDLKMGGDPNYAPNLIFSLIDSLSCLKRQLQDQDTTAQPLTTAQPTINLNPSVLLQGVSPREDVWADMRRSPHQQLPACSASGFHFKCHVSCHFANTFASRSLLQTPPALHLYLMALCCSSCLSLYRVSQITNSKTSL